MNDRWWQTSTRPDDMLAGLRFAPPSPRKLRLFAAACYQTCAAEAASVHCGGWGAVLEAERWAETGVAPDPGPNVRNMAVESFGDPFDHAHGACQWGEYHRRCLAEKADILRDIVRPGRLPQHAAASPWRTRDVVSLAEAVYQAPPRLRPCPCCAGGRPPAVIPTVERTHCHACGGWSAVEDGTLDPVALSVLADAAEEAGCEDDELLGHLRCRCTTCGGARRVRVFDSVSRTVDQKCDHGVRTVVDAIPFNLPTCGGTGRSSLPHYRGCWALDIVLGRK